MRVAKRSADRPAEQCHRRAVVADHDSAVGARHEAERLAGERIHVRHGGTVRPRPG